MSDLNLNCKPVELSSCRTFDFTYIRTGCQRYMARVVHMLHINDTDFARLAVDDQVHNVDNLTSRQPRQPRQIVQVYVTCMSYLASVIKLSSCRVVNLVDLIHATACPHHHMTHIDHIGLARHTLGEVSLNLDNSTTRPPELARLPSCEGAISHKPVTVRRASRHVAMASRAERHRTRTPRHATTPTTDELKPVRDRGFRLRLSAAMGRPHVT